MSPATERPGRRSRSRLSGRRRSSRASGRLPKRRLPPLAPGLSAPIETQLLSATVARADGTHSPVTVADCAGLSPASWPLSHFPYSTSGSMQVRPTSVNGPRRPTPPPNSRVSKMALGWIDRESLYLPPPSPGLLPSESFSRLEGSVRKIQARTCGALIEVLGRVITARDASRFFECSGCRLLVHLL